MKRSVNIITKNEQSFQHEMKAKKKEGICVRSGGIERSVPHPRPHTALIIYRSLVAKD